MIVPTFPNAAPKYLSPTLKYGHKHLMLSNSKCTMQYLQEVEWVEVVWMRARTIEESYVRYNYHLWEKISINNQVGLEEYPDGTRELE